MRFPSGDRTGWDPPSVPGIGRTAASSKERYQSSLRPFRTVS